MKRPLPTEKHSFHVIEISYLIRAQRGHGFDAHGATRRQIGGEQRDRDE